MTYEVQGHPGICSEILSQNKQTKTECWLSIVVHSGNSSRDTTQEAEASGSGVEDQPGYTT